MNPQISHNPISAPTGTRYDYITSAPHIASGSVGAFSLSVPIQSGQTSAIPSGPFLPDPSNHPPSLSRKRKSAERPNLELPGSKKRRVDLIDVHRLEGWERLSPQGSVMLQRLSNDNTDRQSHLRLEHPPSVDRNSSQTDLALPTTRASPTLSSGILAMQEIQSGSAMSASETSIPGSYGPSQPPTAGTSRPVPQLVHSIIGSTISTRLITPRNTPPRRQDQLFLSDPQNNLPRPPKTTLTHITRTGNPSYELIDLCSSEDEDPTDSDHSIGGRSRHKEAQDPGNGIEEESDDDNWSVCLSDEEPEESFHAPDRVSEVQPTHIEKGWIPPVSDFITALYEFLMNFCSSRLPWNVIVFESQLNLPLRYVQLINGMVSSL